MDIKRLTKKDVETIMEIVEGLPRYEWSKIVHTIDKRYSSAAHNVQAGTAEELVAAFESDWKGLFRDDLDG